MEEGIEPVRELLLKSRAWRLRQLPIEGGIEPEKRLLKR